MLFTAATPAEDWTVISTGLSIFKVRNERVSSAASFYYVFPQFSRTTFPASRSSTYRSLGDDHNVS